MDGIFLYSDYVKLREAFNRLYPGELPVGLCITTTKAMPTATTFYSTGIKVMLVRFVPGGTPGVAAINFLDVDNANTINALNRPNLSAADNNTYITGLQTAAKKSVGVDFIDWWNDTLYYHKTNEFEYCFIDRNTFEYFASSSEMAFYKAGTSIGTYLDKTDAVINPLTRGVHFSRAFITMEKSNRIYGDYRTLKLRPHPEPVLQVYDSRPSIAYYLGPPCPPFWSNDGATTTTSSAAPPPSPSMARQVVTPPPDKDCTCNEINMTALHEALKKEEIISADLGPAYRVNFTPIIVATALSFLFIVLAIIAQYSFKEAEGIKGVGRNAITVLAAGGLAFIGYILVQLYRRIVRGL